jgi:M6 family metalloprotease-like protein
VHAVPKNGCDGSKYRCAFALGYPEHVWRTVAAIVNRNHSCHDKGKAVFRAKYRNVMNSNPFSATKRLCQAWFAPLSATTGKLRIALASACLALAAGVSGARALDAKDFGWRMKEAKGIRPLLVIWVREPDDTPANEIERRKRYYEGLIFGRPPHRNYPDALRSLEPTLVNFYRDQSAGQFGWRRAGFVGPLSAPVKGKSALEIARLAVTAAAKEGHFNFRAFDSNRDGRITAEELTILVISNVPHGQSGHFWGDRAFPVPGQAVTFTGGDGVVGEGGGLTVVAHELFHTLGGIDLYGPWGGCYDLNRGLTLMAGAGDGGVADSEHIRNLDPWHKMRAGWIEPRLAAIGHAGKAQLAAQHLELAAEPIRKRPVLVYDPSRKKKEFFLLEYRTPYRLGFDETASTSGLVIWHIAYGANPDPVRLPAERKDCKGAFVPVVSVFVRGAPNWQQGASRAYTSAHGEIALKWMDGQEAGLRVRVAPHKPSDPFIEISWVSGKETMPPPAPQPASTQLGDRR